MPPNINNVHSTYLVPLIDARYQPRDYATTCAVTTPVTSPGGVTEGQRRPSRLYTDTRKVIRRRQTTSNSLTNARLKRR